jgi:hypothetical protein
MQSISNGAGFELKRILRDKYISHVPVLAEPSGSSPVSQQNCGEARESTKSKKILANNKTPLVGGNSRGVGKPISGARIGSILLAPVCAGATTPKAWLCSSISPRLPRAKPLC